MELKDFVNLIGRKKATTVYIVLLFLIVSLVVTFVQPLKYSSTSKLLVVQKYNTYDIYATAKSNEYVSNILSNVVSSYSFYNEVKNSGFAINQDYFQGDNSKQMRTWEKTVTAKSISDSGVMEISVYHTDWRQALEISKAVNEIIKTKHMNYHGFGDRIDIVIIDQPIVSKFPVKPNIFINILIGIALGLIFALGYIYIFPDEKYSWRLRSIFGRRDQTIVLDSYEKPLTDHYGPTEGDYNLSEDYSGNLEDSTESQIAGQEDQPVREGFVEYIDEDNKENR
jgi:capsular polysaccharide biosynthesis protein